MSITEAKPKRENRTIALHLGNTLAEYEATYPTEAGIQAVIGKVEIADSLNWGCLATGHKPGCPRQLRFTHHDSYSRWVSLGCNWSIYSYLSGHPCLSQLKLCN